MEVLTRLLGQWGVIAVVGLLIFIPVFRKAGKLFTWIEDQTFGTRNYINEKFELLFIEVKEEYITWSLIGLSAFCGCSTILIVGIFSGAWLVALFLGVGASLLAFKIPKPIVNKMVEKRHQGYQDQLVDGLTLLSNGIRAGLSVPQALGMVVDEMPPPISQEFGLMLQQSKIGVPLEETFDNLAKRIPSEDNDMFVSGVNILRETGGNLAETFDTIVDVVRDRIKLQQKINTYIAQGMFQGATIAMMPFAIGGIYTVSDPDSMALVFTHPLGIAMVTVALLFDIVGFIVILKVVQIKV